jgi:hypothetical protein
MQLTMDKPARSAALLSRGLFQRRDIPTIVGKIKSIAIGMRNRWNLMLRILRPVRKVHGNERRTDPENIMEKTATPEAGIVSSNAFLGS